jgi:hypothetical protein
MAQTAYFNCHTCAAGRRLPCAIEHLFGEHMCGRQNAVARQRFCPLQGIVFATFLKEGRPKRSILYGLFARSARVYDSGCYSNIEGARAA